MANIINGTDTGSGGLITTGDSSDELQIQTAETTAVTITSGQQSAFIAGTASAPAVTTTGDLNTGIYFPAADNIGFTTGGTIRGRWTTDGLCFGTDTAAANALDDYEEGTWTPSDGSGAGLTFAQNQGRYTKIGREVTCYMAVEYPSTANGNNAQINGLPFTSANNVSQQAFGGAISFTNLNANYAFFIPGNSTATYSHTYAGARQANSVFSSKIVYVVLQYQTA